MRGNAKVPSNGKKPNAFVAILKLIRAYQWIKNGFVLLPVFFDGKLLNAACLRKSAMAFFAYSFCASSIYCFNDIIDAEADKKHPVKCERPVASGAISKPCAFAVMGTLVAVCALALLPLKENAPRTAFVLAVYYAVNIAYSLALKNIAIVDAVIVAAGFVLRLFAGGFATGIPLSRWIVLMTFLLTLFLSLAKRRDDVLRMQKTGEPPRKSATGYNLAFIDQAMTVMGAVMLVCYIMYTVSPETVAAEGSKYVYTTSIFVILGLLRYMQLASVENKTDDPTHVMLRDRFMQLIVGLWVLSFAAMIYVL